MKAKEIIEKAVDNAALDQAAISLQIDDLAQLIGQANNLSTHKDLGMTFSKYVETRQRSNEQMIKLAELQRKLEKEESVGEQVELDEDEIYRELSSVE
jgi:predicted XRE-type DNA-binding protein